MKNLLKFLAVGALSSTTSISIIGCTNPTSIKKININNDLKNVNLNEITTSNLNKPSKEEIKKLIHKKNPKIDISKITISNITSTSATVTGNDKYIGIVNVKFKIINFTTMPEINGEAINALVVDKLDNVYAATINSVFKSDGTNKFQILQTINQGIAQNDAINALVADKLGNVYITTNTNNAIIHKTNNYSDWDNNKSFKEIFVLDKKIVNTTSNTKGNIYFATKNGEIYKQNVTKKELETTKEKKLALIKNQKEEIQELKTAKETLETQLKTIKIQKAKLEIQIESLEARLHELIKEDQNLTRKKMQQNTKLETIKEELIKQEQKLINKKSKIETLETEKSILNNNIKELETQKNLVEANFIKIASLNKQTSSLISCNGNLYIATVDGVYKSNDSDNIFTKMAGTDGKILALAANNNGNVYAASSNGKIYKSCI